MLILHSVQFEKEQEQDDILILVINNINSYKLKDKGFCLRDLLTGEQKEDYNIIYITKGILRVFVYFGFIEIFGTTTGKGNYIYRVKHKITKLDLERLKK